MDVELKIIYTAMFPLRLQEFHHVTFFLAIITAESVTLVTALKYLSVLQAKTIKVLSLFVTHIFSYILHYFNLYK